MTIYYAKALIIYFWKPIAAISGLMVATFLADRFLRSHREHLNTSISDSSLELLKWLAVLLMVVDHANKFLFGGGYAPAFNAGRVVMPIFAMVFAYNLARLNHIPKRVLWRLFLFGAAACLPLFLMEPINNWLPVNVLFMLLLGALVIDCFNRGRWWYVAGFLLFAVGGAFVEYWWPGLALVVGGYYFFKNKSVTALAIVVLGLFLLFKINHNYWAFMSIPIIIGASLIRLELKRNKWFFYAFYPLHLMGIYAVSILLQ